VVTPRRTPVDLLEHQVGKASMDGILFVLCKRTPDLAVTAYLPAALPDRASTPSSARRDSVTKAKIAARVHGLLSSDPVRTRVRTS
jgi:hypothetical protein